MMAQWYAVGAMITFIFALASVMFVNAYYWTSSISKGNEGLFVGMSLLFVMGVPLAWIVSLPAIIVICAGRITYLLRHKRAANTRASE